MFEVTPIPAFRDNYIWMLHHNGHAVLVDPGDAEAAESALQRDGLQLDAMLITHHHDDHIGGVKALLDRHDARVYAPSKGGYTFPHNGVSEQDIVELPGIGTKLLVMETPGHTLDHVVYYGASSLFCGDTLFSCGCGRLFEGSCGQLYHSLQRLAELPGETALYCTHEYTRHNIAFARKVDPENIALRQRSAQVEAMLQSGRPSLPSSMAIELQTNPFLRCNSPAIRRAVLEQGVAADPTDEQIFCAIREMRNSF